MPRFLLSRLSSLGDVVCTLPAASALKRGHPGCEITWVVDPRFAGVVECCTAVDQVIAMKPGLHPNKWPTVGGRFDVALDLQGLFKSGIVVARADAAQKLGYHRQRELSWLMSQRVLPDPSSLHVVDQYVDVARAAGGEADAAEFSLQAKPEDVENVRALCEEKGLQSPLVILNAGAGWATKRWPPEHFARLIDLLSADGVRCALIGGRAEPDRAAASEVVKLCHEKPVDLLGQTSVRELIALLSLAEAHVGGDTGSTHIMAALGRPAIGLYSITNPQRVCPYGQRHRTHYEPEALRLIQPEAVYATVTEALAG
jgi:heptosyltransferase I